MSGTKGINPRIHLRHALAVALATAGCAVAVAACGSSGTSTGGSSSSHYAAGIRFADCMRSHGVPNFPDPSPGGGIQLSSGINPASPAFQSAQHACSKLMPGARRSPAGSESRKLQMVKLAECMRRHGLTTFPDPTSSPPSSAPGGGSGGGFAFGAPGAFLAVPESLIQSPGFKQAAAACHLPGAGKLPGR